MSPEQWEAFAGRALQWALLSDDDDDPDREALSREAAYRDRGPIKKEDIHGHIYWFAGLALFARMMAVAMRSRTDRVGLVQPIQDRNQYDREVRIFGSPSERLKEALHRYHDGSDRGELKTLLNEAWPKKPAPAAGASSRRSGLGGIHCREARGANLFRLRRLGLD